MRYSLLAAIEPRKAFTIGESLQPYERDIKTLAIMKLISLMEAYPPVPRSWYIGIFAITLVATLILIELAPLQLPAWGIFLAIFVAMVFLVPVGIISAVSETTIGTCEAIILRRN